MDYYPVKKCLQVLFERQIPLSKAQNHHLSDFCLALLLAGQTHLSKIARQLDHPTQQASRIQWIRRLLDAPYLTPEYVYYPFIKSLLHSYASPTLHLLIDRTDLVDHETDMVCISLNFHHRAIPLVWKIVPNGMTGYRQQKELINQCIPLIPTTKSVIFHGDNEFGSIATIRYVQQQGWDFILAQSSKNYYYPTHHATPQTLATLPVTPTQAVYCQDILLTKKYQYGLLNLFAFYHPVYHHKRRKQDIRYYATSLPVTQNLRRVGKRRWGIECYFKDLKSAGWQLPMSQLQHVKRYNSLITVLNLAYSWITCLGRWLSKTSQRYLIDNKPSPHLSLFRLGWDWLVHTFICNQLCPVLTTLYR